MLVIQIEGRRNIIVGKQLRRVVRQRLTG
jgi:hypothetical protein